MDNEENRIIDGIRNALLDHEIPYEEGKWEIFHKEYGKELNNIDKRYGAKLIYLWKYAAATAAAIILIIAFLYSPQNPKKQNEFARQDQKILTDPINQSAEVGNRLGNIKETKSSKQTSLAKRVKAMPLSDSQYHEHNTITDLTIIESGIKKTEVIDAEILKDASTRNKTDSNAHKSDNRHFNVDVPEKVAAYSSRWKFGVELNPSLVSDRINLGVGISTQFEVSKKIKLATGLSYSSITANHKFDPIQISPDTNMIGAQSVIKALDIPLSIIYERNNGWYAAVGVSALAVLKESKIYEFESKVLQETFSTDPESGEAVSVFKVVETQYDEESADTDFKGRNNLSYINLAVGKQYKFYSNKKILLEPFVKIPMGALNNNNINLLNSGIRIKLLF